MNETMNIEVVSPHRGAGIILHISSLPSKYGIGSLGQAAYDFADFLAKAGIKYWQVLPLGPTSYGDSPYQSFSSFAGNPYFIDLDLLIEEGYLEAEDLKGLDFGHDPTKVDYGKLYENRYLVLRKAYERDRDKNPKKPREPRNTHIHDYARFMTLKQVQGNKPWQNWDPGLRDPDSPEVARLIVDNLEEYEFHLFMQDLFFSQLDQLKAYLKKQGIALIGDLPVYVAEDSADLWGHKDLFLMEGVRPRVVGGCPPDYFNDNGQLWGNPIYDWDKLKVQDYDFFLDRIRENLKLYDILRIDHFRGLESYWEIPYGDENAKGGRWVKGPGYDLFETFKRDEGTGRIILEDLGYMTKEVQSLREWTGYPGMKVLQFAFNPHHESDYLPHNCTRNWVMYTGTHDNETLKSWAEKAPREEVDFAQRYLTISEEEGIVWGIIRGAWASVCDIAIAQMQDFLELGDEGRMNEPSTLGNWTYRVEKKDLTDELAERIYELTKRYGRVRK